MADDDNYCAAPNTDTGTGTGTDTERALGLGPDATGTATATEGPFAACVLCQEPTEYPESHKGITLCPVCAWQEAQRSACSG